MFGDSVTKNGVEVYEFSQITAGDSGAGDGRSKIRREGRMGKDNALRYFHELEFARLLTHQ